MIKNLKFGFFILLAALQNCCLCAEIYVEELKNFYLSSTHFNCGVGEIAYTFTFDEPFPSPENIPENSISKAGKTEAWDNNGDSVEYLLPQSSITLLNGWKVLIYAQTENNLVEFEIKKLVAPDSFRNAIAVEVVKNGGYLTFSVGGSEFNINGNYSPDDFLFFQSSYNMITYVNAVAGSVYVFNHGKIDYWVRLNNERNVTVFQARQDFGLASHGGALSPKMKFGLGVSFVIGFIVVVIFLSQVKNDTGKNSPIKIGDRKKNPLNKKNSKPNKKSNLAKRPRPPHLRSSQYQK